MARLRFHPRDALPNATILARADALYVELTGAARDELGDAMAAFRLALDSQGDTAIRPARERLARVVASMRR
jgi:molecular chaperone HscC